MVGGHFFAKPDCCSQRATKEVEFGCVSSILLVLCSKSMNLPFTIGVSARLEIAGEQSRSEIFILRCIHDIELLVRYILNLHLSSLSREQVLSHQTMALHSCRVRHGRRVVRGVRRPPRNTRLQVQNKAESRVAVEVVSMQAFGADEAQVLVDAQRWDVVDFCFESDLCALSIYARGIHVVW